MRNIIKFILSVVICQLAGVFGAIFTMPAIKDWYISLQKPSFNPPNWVFGPVWTTLFLLMGISMYLVWRKRWEIKEPVKPALGKWERKLWNPLSEKLWRGQWKEENVIAIFILQLVLNMWWSVIFFGLRAPGVAFFELLALWFAILYTIINFYRISKSAAWLLLPYILWVSFAGVLNFFLWQLN